MKRGQSALEYLVTYGWAILAIVIVAALLWALGIFNPGGLVGTGTKASGFTFLIRDQKYNSTTLELTIANTQGEKVLISKINVTTAIGISTEAVTITTLNTGQAASIIVTAPPCGTAGAKYSDVAVLITYDVIGGIAGHKDSGTISGVCA